MAADIHYDYSQLLVEFYGPPHGPCEGVCIGHIDAVRGDVHLMLSPFLLLSNRHGGN